MGCFDSVFIKCKGCSAELEFQSKAGDCNLDRYRPHNMPPAIAGDLANSAITCRCGVLNTIRVHTLVTIE